MKKLKLIGLIISIFVNLLVLTLVAFAVPGLWVYEDSAGTRYYFDPNTNFFYDSTGRTAGTGNWNLPNGQYLYEASTTISGKSGSNINVKFNPTLTNNPTVNRPTLLEAVPPTGTNTLIPSGETLNSQYATMSGTPSTVTKPVGGSPEPEGGVTEPEEGPPAPTIDNVPTISGVYFTDAYNSPTYYDVNGGPQGTTPPEYVKIGNRYFHCDAQGRAGAPVTQQEVEASYQAQTPGSSGTTTAGSTGSTDVTSGNTAGTQPDPVTLYADGMSWLTLSAEASKYGGWFNFIFGQTEFTKAARTISRWAGYDEDDLSSGQSDAIEWIEIMTGKPDRMGAWLCSDELTGSDGNIFVSNSGYTSFSIEGEKGVVHPCGAIISGSHTLPNGSVVDCRPYFTYKISGEASPAEVAMEFDVYLNRKDQGSDKFESDKDLHLYVKQDTKEALKVKLNRSGAPWTLSGPNIFVYESYNEYESACLEFTQETVDNIQMVSSAFYESDNPFCNDIVDAFVSQEAEASEATAAAGSAGVGPGEAGSTGGSYTSSSGGSSSGGIGPREGLGG